MVKLKRLKMIADLGIVAAGAKNSTERRYELFEKLISMGGLYVKFAQLLLLKAGGDRPDSTYQYRTLLKKAYDTAPYEPIDIHDVLQRELGISSNLLSEVSQAPVAAGSFGQVYRGKLHDGRAVAIKVLRPSVQSDLNFDMRTLKFVSRIISRRLGDDVDIRQVFDKFESVTRQEVNYEMEAGYALEMHQRYLNHPAIVIPMTYSQLSSKRIITQDYIEGLPLTDVFVQKEAGINPEAYVYQTTGSDLNNQMITVGQNMLESMLLQGTAHGDPHPGNIKLLPGDKIALLDFGICAQAPRDKQAFFALVKEYKKIYDDQFDIQSYTWAIVNLFVSDLMSAIRTLDIYNHGQFSKQVFDAVNDAIASIYASSGQDIGQLLNSRNFVRIFGSVINQGNRFGLKIEVEQPEFLRATTMFISVVEALGLKKSVLAVVYTNVVDNLDGTDFPQNFSYTSPEIAMTTIAEWLEKIASKDIYLYMLLSKKINSGGLRV